MVRWQQIAESAAKQSKRMLIPEIHEVMTYKQALEFAKQLDVKLIPYELAKGMKETREILSEIKPGQSVGIFIGPEWIRGRRGSKGTGSRCPCDYTWKTNPQN